MSNPADRAKLMGGGYDAQYGEERGSPGYGMQGGYAAPPEQGIHGASGGRDMMTDAQTGFEQLKRGQVPDFKWKILFFSSAAVVMASAVIADLVLIKNFDLLTLDFIHEVYVTVFGLIMVVLDFPRAELRADALRRAATKYFRFLTLFTGRGIAYIFLATMCFSALWDENINSFLAIILSGYVFVVGVMCVYVGVKESMKLNRLRSSLISSIGDNPNFLSQYLTNRSGMSGMTVEQFSEMSKALGVPFDEETAGFVFDSLRGSLSEGPPFLGYEDISRWTAQAPGEQMGFTVF